MKNKKLYQEGSLMHYADIGFSNIKKLSESSLISEKLLGFNSLMFVLIIAVNLMVWLNNSELFSLTGFVMFLLSLLFAFIISIGYSPLLNVVANFSANKVDSLRVGLIVLFIDFPLSVAGLLYKVAILTKISIIVIGVQIFLILLGSVLKYSKEPTEDVVIEPSDIWGVVNKISAVCGIISFIITIALIIIKQI